jgi:uncharacterized protein (DUF3084 family)
MATEGSSSDLPPQTREVVAAELPATGHVSAPAAAAAADGAAALPAAMPASKLTLQAQIKQLKDEQVQLKQQKQKIAKELKNAQRRKFRLKKRARQLTDQDLVEVLQMRAELSQEQQAAAAQAAAPEPEPMAD